MKKSRVSCIAALFLTALLVETPLFNAALVAQTEATNTIGVRMARLQIVADEEQLQVAPKFGEEQVAVLQINSEDKKPEDRPKVKAGDTVKVLSAAGGLLGFFLVQKKKPSPSQTVQAKDGAQTLNVPGNYRTSDIANLEGRTASGSVLQPLAKTDSDAVFCGTLNPEDIQKGTRVQAVDKNTGEVKGKADYHFVAVIGAWTKPMLSKPGVLVDLYVGVEGNQNSKMLVNVPLPSGLVFADGTTMKSYVKTVKDLNRPIDKIKSTEPVVPGQRRTYAIPITMRLIQEEDGISKVGEWAEGIVTDPRPTLNGYVPNARRTTDLKVTIDGQPADTTFDRTSGAFRVKPKEDLPPGNHTVSVSVQRNNEWIPLTITSLLVKRPPTVTTPPTTTTTQICGYVPISEPGTNEHDILLIYAHDGEDAVIGNPHKEGWLFVGSIEKEKTSDGMVKIKVEASTYWCWSDTEYWNFQAPTDGNEWGLINKRMTGYQHNPLGNCLSGHEPFMKVQVDADVSLSGSVTVENLDGVSECDVHGKVQGELWTVGIEADEAKRSTLTFDKKDDNRPTFKVEAQVGVSSKEGASGSAGGSIEMKPPYTRELQTGEDNITIHRQGVLHEKGTLNYKGMATLKFYINDYALKAELKVAPTEFKVEKLNECKHP